jgi:phage tail tape-measure protein
MTTIRHSLLIAVAAGLLFSGCATDPGRTTAKGAGLGAVIGAAAGAIIGNQSGEAGKGALVGACVGGLIGAGVGNAKEAKEKEAAKPKE